MSCMVDVGARVGPRPEWFDLGFHVIGFEPDVEECSHLKTLFCHHTFVPLALDSKPGRRTLYITENNQCSSFYYPFQDLAEAGMYGHRLIGTREVEATTLDLWFEEHGNGERPELIKLDTQGSELDILKGATETLKTALVVMSEVEFRPFYRDQPLFEDVNAFMRDHGFELIGLQDMNYAWDMLYWCDAYWARLPMSDRAREIARRCGCATRS